MHLFLSGVAETAERATRAAMRTKFSQPAVTKAIGNLERFGIVQEQTGRRRNKLYVYGAYLKILEEGTEPIR
jgi:Fic family protein